MQGVASCTAKPIPVTIQEAMVEAAIKAKEYRLQANFVPL